MREGDAEKNNILSHVYHLAKPFIKSNYGSRVSKPLVYAEKYEPVY